MFFLTFSANMPGRARNGDTLLIDACAIHEELSANTEEDDTTQEIEHFLVLLLL